MKPYTMLDKIIDFIWRDRINSIEYYFAKKWLNKNFGEYEFWGDTISEWKKSWFDLTSKEFPKGKELYCPRCYFDDDKEILKVDCDGHNE